MTSTTHRPVEITAQPGMPTITMTRDFDAPVEHVFRAHTDPDLFARWIGPRGLTVHLDRYDARTGGAYRYTMSDSDGSLYGFFGAFHEVRPDERIVQTFTWEGAPDGVSLDTATFEDLGEGRCRLTTQSVVESVETRDLIIASGMETGVVEGYEKLDEILAEMR
jgi:uncharacterized protein YndB with AHSA1/START domain